VIKRIVPDLQTQPCDKLLAILRIQLTPSGQLEIQKESNEETLSGQLFLPLPGLVRSLNTTYDNFNQISQKTQ
jgi:hypothetical protein